MRMKTYWLSTINADKMLSYMLNTRAVNAKTEVNRKVRDLCWL